MTERLPTDVGTREGRADSLRLVAPQEISLLRVVYYLIVPYHQDEKATDPVKQLREKFEAAGGKSCQAKLTDDGGKHESFRRMVTDR